MKFLLTILLFVFGFTCLQAQTIKTSKRKPVVAVKTTTKRKLPKGHKPRPAERREPGPKVNAEYELFPGSGILEDRD